MSKYNEFKKSLKEFLFELLLKEDAEELFDKDIVSRWRREINEFFGIKKPFVTYDFVFLASNFCDFTFSEDGSITFQSLYEDDPVSFIDFLNLAFLDLLYEYYPEVISNLLSTYAAEKVFLPNNLPDVYNKKVKDLTVMDLGKIVQSTLVLRRASDVKVYTYLYTLYCPYCGYIFTSRTYSNVCPRCGKKGVEVKKKFNIARLGVVLEDPIENGKPGDSIYGIIRGALASYLNRNKILTPGYNYKVIGVVDLYPIAKKEDVYKYMLNIIYIEPMSPIFAELEISDSDLKKIKELAKRPDVYDLLKDSIAPSIYGLDIIKEAIVLQLFGGYMEDGSRGNIHILLVGDPGVGKSALLMEVSKVAPISIYCGGKGVSAAGLTAAVIKDPFVGTWAVEAGVLPLCNKGIACIDEIDKMDKKDRESIHIPMEQQIVTISKANLKVTMPAETSILAAANPKYRSFDEDESIAEQINLPPDLLSRFDLIFAIKSKDIDLKTLEEEATFILKGKPREGPIPRDLIKKWVYYARNTVFPRLSEEAEKRLKEFFLKVVAKSRTHEPAPIPMTARQLESLKRLATASARVQLRNYVTIEDAERAIRLVTYFLRTLAWDPEIGSYDITKLESGVSKSKRKKISLVKEIIFRFSEEYSDGVPLSKIIEEYCLETKQDKNALTVLDEISDIISILKKNGEILEPKNGRFKLVH